MNQRRRNNNIFMGVVLILLAAYITVTRLVSLPSIPVFKILFTCMFVYLVFKGVKKKDYGLIFIPGAFILCQYDDVLGIESITPFIVMLAAILLTIGFNLIFKKDHYETEVVYDSGSDGGLISDYTVDDEKKKIVIENGLGSTTRYIQEENIRKVFVDNGLGSCTVYFQNCTLENNSLKMKIDNGLGSCTIYFPKEWSINLTQDNGLGDIRVLGQPSSDPMAPCVNVFVDNGLGSVKLNFI